MIRTCVGVLLLAAALPSASPAQDGSAGKSIDTGFAGTVVYEEQVKFDVNLPPQMQRFRDRMDDTRKANIVLIFNESASLSQPAPEPEVEQPQAAPNDRRNRRFRMFRNRENNATFIDFDNEVAVQRREFLDRTFLVEGAPKPDWKLTDDVSEFLGFMCNRAVAIVDTTLVEAWFTTEIPVPAGPDDYYGLPGLILVLTTDNGNRSYVATDVSMRAVDPAIITAPTEGKRVTRDEFNAIVAEKRKEMEATRGQGRSGEFRRIRRQ
jgi:GLPGLI family protein